MYILEWFLENYVTLKTGVKADEKFDLHHWNKFKKKKIERLCVCVCVCVCACACVCVCVWDLTVWEFSDPA